jgi:FtsP/CotA-like multicopper oxidase with cupredoxin domain
MTKHIHPEHETSSLTASLSRRDILKWGTVAGSALVLPNLMGCSNKSADLVEPGVLRPVNGLLNVEMSASQVEVTIGKYRFTAKAYSDIKIIDGQGTYEVNPDAHGLTVPGPTIEVSPGDKIRLRLYNKLTANGSAHQHGGSSSSDDDSITTTNLHTHGLHISPASNQDNVLLRIKTGESRDYEFDIPKGLPMPDGSLADHPSGTYWYHPHLHGSTTLQVMGGMAGALIVRGGPDDLTTPGADQERLLVIGELMLKSVEAATERNPGDSELASFEQIFQGVGNTDGYDEILPVNGQLNPVIRLRPNELQRWRLIHAGYHYPLNLALVKSESDDLKDLTQASADFQDFHQIALDGINFAKPKLITRPVEDQEKPLLSPLVLAPGNRADLLMRLAEKGTYKLVTLGFDMGGAMAAPHVLATVIVEKEPAQSPEIPATLVTPALYPPIGDDEVPKGSERTISFAVDICTPAGPKANPDDIHFTIGDQLFDHTRVDQCVQQGAVEAWTIKNVNSNRTGGTAPGPHPFHIHVNSFMVTHINGEAVPEPVWQDTILLPKEGDAEDPASGSITFRTRFLHFAGKYVLHCHILYHEDLGMMQLVQVNASSGMPQPDGGGACEQLPPKPQLCPAKQTP